MRPSLPMRCRPTRRFPCVLGVLLALSPSLSPVVTTSRADDVVRGTQEELRKRKLYFGDIDGVLNRGTIGALRRYQERKRLAVTGDPDPETLRSLDIIAPTGAEPLPDTPVLRSDLARRPPPAGEAVILVEQAPTPDESVDGRNASSRPTAHGIPQTVGADASSTAPAPAPATPGPALVEPGPLSAAAVRAYLEGYLRDGSTNSLAAEMGYYAPRVDYFESGPMDRDLIRRDISSYYKRWPERRYEIDGPVAVTPGAHPGETVARFRLRFTCRSPKHRARGRTENVFTLQSTLADGVRIVGMKEVRVP